MSETVQTQYPVFIFIFLTYDLITYNTPLLKQSSEPLPDGSRIWTTLDHNKYSRLVRLLQ